MVHLIIIKLSLNSIATFSNSPKLVLTVTNIPHTHIQISTHLTHMSSTYCTSKDNSFFSLQARLPEGSGVVRWTFTGVIVRRGTSLCSDPEVHEHLLLLPCGSRLRPYGDLWCRDHQPAWDWHHYFKYYYAYFHNLQYLSNVWDQ